MDYSDLLLGALTYPDATSDRAIRSGVALARRIGGELTVMAVQVDIPVLHNRLANALVRLDELAVEQEARSAEAGERAGSCAAVAAAEAGVQLTVRPIVARLYAETEMVCAAARTHDLFLVPIGPAAPADRALAEAVLFGSGRPTLVYPEAVEITPRDGFATVAIAWDGSARAARSVADALPILRKARDVLILVAVGEKPQATPGIAHDLIRHLKTHGVEAVIDERRASHQPIGRTLREYAKAHQLDLLVMGGFGHARVQEFVLGGATASILEAPPCPVLMSH